MLTESFKSLVRLLRQRGEDKDTIKAITGLCVTCERDEKSYISWLEAHPDADHDTLFEYALTEYGGYELPQRQ